VKPQSKRGLQTFYQVGGAIVASLDSKYGDGAVVKFAGEVMLSARTVWLYRQVHKFYENCNRLQFLTWKHHLVAMHTDDAWAALQMAEDEGLSAASLARRMKVLIPATGEGICRGREVAAGRVSDVN
jgi:hypothetical protein